MTWIITICTTEHIYSMLDYLSPDSCGWLKTLKDILTLCSDDQNNSTCEWFLMWLKTGCF